MNIVSNISKKFQTTSTSVLLSCVVFTIFIVPLFPASYYLILYLIGYSFIFILAALAVNKYRSGIFLLAMLIFLLQWISFLFVFTLLVESLRILTILFFFVIVFSFIGQVASAEEVSFKVIVESINGYLMLGLAFGTLIALIMYFNPDTYNFPGIDVTNVRQGENLSSYLYYAFVTLTTLGYGDIIPKLPGTKSLAIFIAITGQFYIAIIITTLVSKYLNQKKG